MNNPHVVNITATSSIPTSGYYFSNSLWRWEGKNPDEEILMRAVAVNYDYFETFEMEMADGRGFSKDFAGDTTSWIVNEAAAEIMGMKKADGKLLSINEYSGPIIGIVKNYNFSSLHSKIDPLIMFLNPDNCNNICVRIASGDISGTLKYIEDVHQKFNPERPFKYNFLDESLDNLYQSEERIEKIFRSFSYLAVFISCLGLFGLASFMAEKRTKEIGIRKVLGATVANLIGLISREFIILIVLSVAIASPIAWYAMTRWLDSFAYKTEFGIEIFIFAGLATLGIALASVSYQAAKAALNDPVKSLRYE